jgi:hypothetical protein
MFQVKLLLDYPEVVLTSSSAFVLQPRGNFKGRFHEVILQTVFDPFFNRGIVGD